MVQEYEKKVPVFDYDTGDFKVDMQGRVVTVTEAEAVVQIALKAVNTVRGVCLIYANMEDSTRHHKYGNDLYSILRAPGLSEAARISEMERAIEEALVFDPWITKVTDIRIKRARDMDEQDPYLPKLNKDSQPDEVYASYTIHHTFGKTNVEGVLLNA